MEAENLIPDENIAGFSKRILEREYEEIAKMSVGVIVAAAFDVIREYREKGMTFDQIASAYTKNGVPMKGATLRWAFGRAMKSRKSLQNAPSAREEGKQKEAKPAAVSPAPAPKPAATTPAPAPATPAAQPTAAQPTAAQTPSPRKIRWGRNIELKRPIGCSDEQWELAPKIYKILTEIPAHDREYPELAELRWWTDSSGQKRDVLEDFEPQNKSDDLALTRARAIYHANRKNLMEKWGIAQIINDQIMPRYRIAEEYLQPLTVDLDDLIAKHLD